MSRPSKFTDAQVADMVARRLKGGRANSYGAIAARYGCAAHTVRRLCLLAGLKAAPRPLDKFPSVTSRNGVAVRRFSPADDAALLRMKAQHVRPSEMARVLGRHDSTIANRLVALAAYEARP
jgi:DNA invertase Pin-like site-specific DNA recombinase